MRAHLYSIWATTLLLVGICAGVVMAPAAQVPTDPNSYTAKIIRPEGHGSAVHVGGGVYITAAHVVDGTSNVGVLLDTGVTVRANVLMVDTSLDIAVLLADRHLPRAAARISCRDPVAGESLSLVGNPLSIDFVTLRGHVAGKPRALGPWASVFPVGAPVVGGMSGGPVIDDSGRVIGIIVGVMRFGLGVVGIGTVVPASAICRSLKSI